MDAKKSQVYAELYIFLLTTLRLIYRLSFTFTVFGNIHSEHGLRWFAKREYITEVMLYRFGMRLKDKNRIIFGFFSMCWSQYPNIQYSPNLLGLLMYLFGTGALNCSNTFFPIFRGEEDCLVTWLLNNKLFCNP